LKTRKPLPTSTDVITNTFLIVFSLSSG
jgi:hypothetical protein